MGNYAGLFLLTLTDFRYTCVLLLNQIYVQLLGGGFALADGVYRSGYDLVDFTEFD